MSNSLGIAAVTATLHNLIAKGIELEGAGIPVTTRPPDKARNGGSNPNQINLFLYQTMPNGAWRNMDIPRQVRPGETSHPPLALNLYYLVTAYGENDDDIKGHRLLGRVMSIFDDFPVLGSDEINQILLTESGLREQVEQVRITPQPLSLDEMSKLWSTFQTQYRISATYQVSAVLIESTRPTKAPLPVLKRGEADRGVTAVASAALTLKEIRLPRSQPAARLGENIVLIGEQLTTVDTVTRFTSLRLPNPIELPPTTGDTAGELRVHLPNKTEDPNALSRWAPGFYTLALVVKHSGVPPMVSNELALALAPQITVTPLSAATGTVNLTVTSEPRTVAGQRMLLLFGDRQIEPQTVTTPADTSKPTTMTFAVSNVVAGKYLVRLRVDGVDSIPVVYSDTPPTPSFDPNQQVTIT
jgi:uncharacterized protein DUF4255